MTATSRLTAYLAAFGLLALLGVVLLVAGLASSAGLAVLGLFLLCVGAVAAYSVGSTLRRAAHPLEPVLTTVDGEPALFLPRWKRQAVVGVGSSLALGVPALAAGVLALTADRVVLGVVLMLVGLALLPVPLLALLGRWAPGGLWLTPTRLVHRTYTARSSTRWADVVDVSFDLPPVVHVRAAEQGYTVPFLRRGVKITPGELVLDTTDLPTGPAHVALLVSTYVKQPELRAELGSEESLRRFHESLGVLNGPEAR